MFICLFVYLFISVIYLLFFLHISKLNRTFDFVLDMQEKMQALFLHISKLNRTFVFKNILNIWIL